MRKSADAFRTISEVAEELDVPKHVLRFWEIKFPQIRPMKRGGGRRYYRPEDIELLSGIRALLHSDGYTIKGVQKILKQHGADYAKAYGRNDATATANGQRSKTSDTATTKSRRRSAKSTKSRSTKVADLAGEHREMIEKAVSELQSCRELLQSGLGRPSVEPQTRARCSWVEPCGAALSSSSWTLLRLVLRGSVKRNSQRRNSTVISVWSGPSRKLWRKRLLMELVLSCRTLQPGDGVSLKRTQPSAVSLPRIAEPRC